LANKSKSQAFSSSKQNLPRTMTVAQLVLVAVGSIIGAGFFLGSGVPLFNTGRSAILAYLLGGVFMYLIVSILAEIAAAQPVEGGFSTYAGEYFGPWLGFVSGWMYWTSGVMTMASEVVAAAIFTMLWFPGWPLWIFTVIYSLIMILINTRDTAGFARAEGALSLIKLAALALFIILSGFGAGKLLMSATILPKAAFFEHIPLFPHGWQGFWGSMPFVMFGYTGTSVVAMAAAETRDPARTIPKAIRITTGIVLALYLSAIFLITLLLPAGGAGTKVSPFVLTLNRLHLRWPAFIMNVVILIAALSSMNTALYGVTRMLRSLGERGGAPPRMARLNRRGVPDTALWLSSIALGLTITLSYFLPETAFTSLSGATSLVSMFNWGLIALTHIRFRKANRDHGAFHMWGYPWTSYLALTLAIIVAASAWLVPGQRIGLIGLLALFSVYSLVYRIKILQR
jgi:L-asparagine transporter-like permease